MIMDFKRKTIRKATVPAILVAAMAFGLAACANPDTSSSQTNEDQSAAITLEDQKTFQNAIEAFGAAIEIGDYQTAEKYCAADFKAYLESLISDQGPVTDTFSLAIVNNLPIKLVSVEGYYDEGENGLDFNITEDKPTVNFLVTFEIQQQDGQKDSAGGYTQGVRGADGEWLIGGFASGR
jgi:hypothetical protein